MLRVVSQVSGLFDVVDFDLPLPLLQPLIDLGFGVVNLGNSLSKDGNFHNRLLVGYWRYLNENAKWISIVIVLIPYR